MVKKELFLGPLRRIYAITKKYPFRSIPVYLGLAICFGYLSWYFFERLPARNWNPAQIKEIGKIGSASSNDLRFAVMGDNKENYPVLEASLRQISREPGIGFALNLGDLVSVGEERDFQNFIGAVRKNLNIPLITVLGNHDIGERGRGLYCDIFGAAYYSFQAGRNYFIALDDADSAGLDEKQFQWLASELEKAQPYDTRIILMHVPPYNPPGFPKRHCLNAKAAGRLMDLLKKYRATYIFAGHIHGYYTGQWEEIPYVISGGSGAELMGADPAHFFYHYIVVNIKNGAVTTELRKVAATTN